MKNNKDKQKRCKLCDNLIEKRRIYCSNECRWKDMVGKKQSHPGARGRKAWNKGKKGLQPWMNLAGLNKKRGKLPKGNIPWNKGEKCPQLAGKNCHLWKGGITPINRAIRASFEYRLWRKSCFERDNFTCQKYGISGGKLVVHHINNFADFSELRFAIDNGITLSKKAHKEFHKIYGNRNNTREQLGEFLGKEKRWVI